MTDLTKMTPTELRAMVDELRVMADRIESTGCTGLAASWCPIHGDCVCPERENRLDDWNCPLHNHRSSHAESDLAQHNG